MQLRVRKATPLSGGRTQWSALRGVVAALVLTATPWLGAVAQDKVENPHGTMDVPCATCHTSDGWKPARFAKEWDHGKYAGMRLEAGHAAVSCASCHKTLEFNQVEKTCAGCHQDVHKGELGVQCADCHNTRAFTDRSDQIQSHALTRFPLEGAHRTVDCRACHTSGGDGTLAFRGAPTVCISCHQREFNATRNPNHPAAGFQSDCTVCHGNLNWTTARFDHDQTKFPLTGAHRAAVCQDCHADGQYRTKPTTCVSCHQTNFTASQTPPHEAAHFPTGCADCHTTTKWQGATYDHNLTKFPLTGAHQAATCDACHADKVFVGKSSTCVSCHQPQFAATKTPPHQAAGFPTDCASCHTTSKWLGAPYDHTQTKFPLTGGHRSLACEACHADQIYVGKATTCVSCHQKDYTNTKQPSHGAAGFPTDCATCHTTANWLGAVYDHSQTKFPLTGAHLAASCAACHADNVYQGKPTACVSCHATNYANTRLPPHQAAGFATNCTDCHTTTKWAPATFDHNATKFPLTGAHVAVPCMQCHADGVYVGKPTICASCHQPDYDKSTQPPHRAAGFPTDCTTCHTTIRWVPSTFNHGATKFPLTGAHIATPCTQCHGDGVYAGKPTACVSCHATNYANTKLPPHQAAGFGQTCSDCHTTVQWVPGTFDHGKTLFPLTGAHLAATCMQCHADGVYQGKPTTCVSCHQPDYTAAKAPPHLGFPTTCSDCHTTTKWIPGSFDHNATLFPLTGAHLAATCVQCHADGVYKGKPTTCVSCHQPEYTATTQPPHQAAGFATTCATCHTTTKWVPGTYDHNATSFALTGAHVAVPCMQCHADGVYNGKPTTCVSCHQADFNATTNPNHQTVHFPTTCTDCHTTTQWTGATFNHDTPYFPIYSGAHRGTWNACTDCHTDPATYATFTCLTCHGKSTTDSHHSQVSGYQYTSVKCYACHPRGTH